MHNIDSLRASRDSAYIRERPDVPSRVLSSADALIAVMSNREARRARSDTQDVGAARTVLRITQSKKESNEIIRFTVVVRNNPHGRA